jgi:hypothetical protein
MAAAEITIAIDESLGISQRMAKRAIKKYKEERDEVPFAKGG